MRPSLNVQEERSPIYDGGKEKIIRYQKAEKSSPEAFHRENERNA